MFFIVSYAHLDCAGNGDIVRKVKWRRWRASWDEGLDSGTFEICPLSLVSRLGLAYHAR
jgi:hypothetical protein